MDGCAARAEARHIRGGNALAGLEKIATTAQGSDLSKWYGQSFSGQGEEDPFPSKLKPAH